MATLITVATKLFLCIGGHHKYTVMGSANTRLSLYFLSKTAKPSVSGAVVSSCYILLSIDDTVPGKASLIYDVELLEIEKGHRPTNFFGEIDTDGDNLLSQDEVIQMISVDLGNSMNV